MNQIYKICQLLVVATLLAPLIACSQLNLGNASYNKPQDIEQYLSKEAATLVKQAYSSIDVHKLTDYHMHVLGMGAGNTGAYINPEFYSWQHPIKRLQFSVYKSAANIETHANADQEYVERLISLIQHSPHPGRYRLLAFDRYYDVSGNVVDEKTEFYIPNEYVYKLSLEHPNYFEPAVSIHPYRKDALSELEKWAKKGVRMVKWLPNAMGIDPSNKNIQPYYELMKRYNMVLLSHTGQERAVEAQKDQYLGNPLLLRFPLDIGVKVIAAHCASTGTDQDLDKPGNPIVDSFDLFMRMMDEQKYEGLLFGDLSAITQINRKPAILETLLARQDLHSRLVNGSDYPLPAVNVLVHSWYLQWHGFITNEERVQLKEIFTYNPLIFDFILKRTLKHPVSKLGFQETVFLENKDL